MINMFIFVFIIFIGVFFILFSVVLYEIDFLFIEYWRLIKCVMVDFFDLVVLVIRILLYVWSLLEIIFDVLVWINFLLLWFYCFFVGFSVFI